MEDLMTHVVIGGIVVTTLPLLGFLVLKEFTYFFERIEDKKIVKKNKNEIVAFPDKEWAKFLDENELGGR